MPFPFVFCFVFYTLLYSALYCIGSNKNMRCVPTKYLQTHAEHEVARRFTFDFSKSKVFLIKYEENTSSVYYQMFCITHIEECNNNVKEMNCVPHPKIVFTPFNLYLTFFRKAYSCNK